MSMNLKIKVSFNREINDMLDKSVKVVLKDSESYYLGELSGYNVDSGALALSNVENENREKFTKVILHSDAWTQIFLTAPRFPMKELADEIGKIFPAGQVKFSQDSNTINILNGKIIVNDSGVVGSGPTAARVKKVYDEFIGTLKE